MRMRRDEYEILQVRHCEIERTNGAVQLFISRDCLFIKLMPGASTMIRLKQWWSSLSTLLMQLPRHNPDTNKTQKASKRAGKREGGTVCACVRVCVRARVPMCIRSSDQDFEKSSCKFVLFR